jgi:hypothetical protein
LAQVYDAREAAKRGTPATVVLAGEPRQGKTALVNALVRRDGLMREGVTTAAFVAISHGAGGARVHRIDGSTLDVPLDDLPRWAADPEGDVAGIRVTLPEPSLLERLELVDTPGLGGLSRAHGRLALDAVARADSLVLVSDGGSELLEAELRFLAEANRGSGGTIVAVTKAQSFAAADAVVARDRELATGRVPGARVIGVDAALAHLAATEPDEDEAAALWRDSGFDELERVLDAVAARVQTLRIDRLLQVTEAVARSLLAGDKAVIAAHAAKASPADDVDAFKRELDDFKRIRRRAKGAVEDGFADLKRDLKRFADLRVEAMENQFNALIAANAAHDLERELAAARAAVRLEVREKLEQDVAVLARDHCSGIDVEFSLTVRRIERRQLLGRVEPSMLHSTLAPAGGGVARGLIWGPLGAVGGLFGLVVGASRYKATSRAYAQADAEHRVRDVATKDQRELRDDVEAAIAQARRTVMEALEVALDDREQELKRIVVAAGKPDKADPAGPSRARVGQLESHLKRIAQIRAALAEKTRS